MGGFEHSACPANRDAGRNIPSDFPMDTIESAVDYSYVSIGGRSFLLPVHAETLGFPKAPATAATTSLTSAIITNLEST